MPIPIRFSVFEGDQLVRTETLEQDVIKVGKLESSHLRIDDEGVSRMHSVIEVSGPGEVYIIDLGSAAGTVVNGQKVNKARLESGDQLQFGNTVVVVEIGVGAEADAGAEQVAEEAPLEAQTSPGMAFAAGAAAAQHAGGAQVEQGYAEQAYAQQGYAQQGYAQQDYGYAQQADMHHGHEEVNEDDLSNERIIYQMIPATAPVNPAELESAESAVEVVVMWGEHSILHVEHLSPPRAFTVGEAVDAKGKQVTDFLIGSESIGTDQLPITAEAGAGVAVVIPAGAVGDVTVNEQTITFEELAAQGQLQASSVLAGAQQYPLPPGATARVWYRGFMFIVRPMAAGRAIGVGGAQTSWKDYLWTIVSMAFHIGLLLLFYFLPPQSSSLSLDLLTADDRFAKYLIEPPEMVEEETPEWLEETPQEDDEGGKGKRHKDEEGQMGKKDEKKTKNKFGIEGPQDNQDPQMAREEAKEMAANAGIIGILKASVGAFNSPTSPYGADTALGSDPMSALGALMGDQIGGNFGFGGLGLRGTGRGGGGTGEGTIGLGNIGTIGHGAGGGTGSGYGSGAGGFHGRTSNVPHIRTGKADVRGSLSKEVIRRIIRRHINEVRFCYEQELNSRPDLKGRIAVKFIVSPTGAVQTAAVASSTMGNAKVEQCIAKAVGRWTFPAPDGGGIVVVTYPFVLEQTGG